MLLIIEQAFDALAAGSEAERDSRRPNYYTVKKFAKKKQQMTTRLSGSLRPTKRLETAA
jgi:hypothetical protein